VHVPLSKDAKVDWEKIEDAEYFNKRIGIKILKQRAQPMSKFEPLEFKAGAMRELALSESVKEFRLSNLKSLNQSNTSLQGGRGKMVSSPRENKPYKKSVHNSISKEAQANAAARKKRVNDKL
jgi:hypothetical protein